MDVIHSLLGGPGSTRAFCTAPDFVSSRKDKTTEPVQKKDAKPQGTASRPSHTLKNTGPVKPKPVAPPPTEEELKQRRLKSALADYDDLLDDATPKPKAKQGANPSTSKGPTQAKHPAPAAAQKTQQQGTQKANNVANRGNNGAQVARKDGKVLPSKGGPPPPAKKPPTAASRPPGVGMTAAAVAVAAAAARKTTLPRPATAARADGKSNAAALTNVRTTAAVTKVTKQGVQYQVRTSTATLAAPAPAPSRPPLAQRPPVTARPLPKPVPKRPAREDLDEYEDDFVVDEDDDEGGGGGDWRKALRRMTGYDPGRYKDVGDDRSMEAGWRQVEAEEKRSQRLGRLEDQKEEEAEQRRQKIKASKKLRKD